MANTPKGAGNFLGPLAIVTAIVVAALVATFILTGDEPADQPTVIDEDINAEPAGSGTMPEGEADETEEGITDQIDDVTPAAPGEDSVPPAEQNGTSSADAGAEGESDADETVADTADEPVVTDEPAQGAGGEDTAGDTAPAATSTGQAGTGGADGELGDEQNTGGENDANQTATEEFLLDEETVDEGSESNIEADDPQAPEGRDAQTDLTPEEGQDVVEDTDEGGTAFVPTPSGPEGRDNETIAD